MHLRRTTLLLAAAVLLSGANGRAVEPETAAGHGSGQAAEPETAAGHGSGQAEHIVRSAVYEGLLSPEHADFTATYEIEVLKSRGEVPVGLLSGPVSLRTFKTSSRSARLSRQGDKVAAVLSGKGRHEITAEFSVSVGKRADDVWSRLSFGVTPSVVGQIEVTADGEDSSIEFLSGTSLGVTHDKGETRLQGYVGMADRVELRWQAKVKEKKIKPVVICNAHHLAEITANVLKLQTRMIFEIPQGETSTFEAELPADLAILRVAGENVRDWALVENEGAQTCKVELLKPVTGRYILTIFSERPIDALPAELQIPEIKAGAVDRQGGSLALVPSEVVLAVKGTEALSRIDNRSFAGMGAWEAKGLADRLQAAFRFNAPGYRCAVNVTAIEPEISVRYTVSANAAEKRLQIGTAVDLDVARSGIFSLAFEVPAGLEVTDVAGASVEDWQVKGSDGGRELSIDFGRKVIGRHTLSINMEQTYESPAGELVVTGLRAKGVTRERGRLSVAAGPGIQVREAGADGLRGIPVRNLQAQHPGASLAFEFRAAEWSLVLDAEKVEPRVTAEVFNLITIGDGILGGSATVDFTVAKAGVQEFLLKIPANWQNVDITGLDIRRKAQEDGTWRVALQDRILGRYKLVITYDQPFDPGTDAITPFGLETVQTVHEAGHVVVTAGSHLEVHEGEGTKGVRRIDARELPARHLAVVENPILRAYSYGAHPYVLTLKTVRHKRQEPLDAVADRAKLVTVVTKPGRRETQATYLIKNNMKDSLRVDLPEGAKLWTVFVDNAAVKPELHEGTVIVPLKKPENRDRAYPVELLYIEQGKAISRFFRTPLALNAPRADIHGAFVEWDVYLPSWV